MAKGASVQFDSEEEYEEVKAVAREKGYDYPKYIRKLVRDDMGKSKSEKVQKEPEIKQEVKQEIKPVLTNSTSSSITSSGSGTFQIDIPKQEVKKEVNQQIVKERKKRMEEADKEEFRKMIREESTKVYNKKDDEKALLNRLDKIYEKQCEGEECMKNLEKSHNTLKNEVASIKEEEPCIGCTSKVKVGSSYCPSCGLKITGWSQLPDWKPSWSK